MMWHIWYAQIAIWVLGTAIICLDLGVAMIAGPEKMALATMLQLTKHGGVSAWYAYIWWLTPMVGGMVGVIALPLVIPQDRW